MTEHIKIEKSDGILSLTMARPDKKNALTNAMYGALADAMEAAETDPSVRVLLIRGEGDMFTAGNDVGEFAAIATGAFQGERHVGRFVQALAKSQPPAGRRRSGTRRRHRHHDAAALRSGRAGRERAALDTVRQSCAGAGSGFQPVDAAPHRLCARLRDVRARRSRRCQIRVDLGPCQPRRCRSTSSMRKQGRLHPGWRNSRRAPSVPPSG